MLKLVQLRQYESHLGVIPIGVEKANGFFPISIAVGFLILANILSETIRLPREYHYYHKMRRLLDKMRSCSRQWQISHSTPIWIDPVASRFSQAILLIPCVICVLSVSVISYTWTFSGPKTTQRNRPM